MSKIDENANANLFGKKKLFTWEANRNRRLMIFGTLKMGFSIWKCEETFGVSKNTVLKVKNLGFNHKTRSYLKSKKIKRQKSAWNKKNFKTHKKFIKNNSAMVAKKKIGENI